MASGTNGVTSATGSFHAQAVTDFTRWGGYNLGAGGGVPTVFQEYTTSVDIYLDLAATATNDVGSISPPRSTMPRVISCVISS